jgi:NitT/TauT family transport system substrate-binding protein
MNDQKQGVTALGAIVSALLVVGLIALGIFMIRRHNAAPPGGGEPTATSSKESDAPEVMDAKVEVPRLSPAERPDQGQRDPGRDQRVRRYAGLIAANGGLDPSENSVFFKNYGVKVKLTISEGENWSALNEGKIAASVTTATCSPCTAASCTPSLRCRSATHAAPTASSSQGLTRINALKGKVIATAQFTKSTSSSDISRQEAGLPVNALASLDAPPRPDRVNVVYTEDGFAAGDLFARGA